MKRALNEQIYRELHTHIKTFPSDSCGAQVIDGEGIDLNQKIKSTLKLLRTKTGEL